MEKILKMVYGNQKQVNLESQVVELGMVDDAKKIVSKYKSVPILFKQSKDNLEKGIKTFNQAKKDLDLFMGNAMRDRSKYKDSVREVGAVWNKLVDVSKELGINVYEIDGAKDLDNLLIELSKSLSSLSGIIDKSNNK